MMKSVLSLVVLVALLLASGPLFAGQTGNIAVASNDKTPGAPVADRMGRSPFYLVFDGRGNFLKTVENPNFGKGPGSGRGASAIDSIGFDEKGVITGGVPTPSRDEREQTWTGFSDFFMANGIGVVIAEVFGDEIVRGMKERGIECVAFKGSSEEAVRRIVRRVRNGADNNTAACKEGDESCTATHPLGPAFRTGQRPVR
jgi:predicted Fe-Mo cluster-binding NifX family protein